MVRKIWLIDWKGYTIELMMTNKPKVSSHLWSISDPEGLRVGDGHMCNVTKNELEEFCKDYIISYEKRSIERAVHDIEQERRGNAL